MAQAEKHKLISILAEKAELLGWGVLMGPEEYQNYEAGNISFSPGMRVLILYLKPQPIYQEQSHIVKEWKYSGNIAIGAKLDNDGDHAKLDETFRQKYTKRLEPMAKELSDFIGTASCSVGFTQTQSPYEYGLNVFNTGLDIVGTEIEITWD